MHSKSSREANIFGLISRYNLLYVLDVGHGLTGMVYGKAVIARRIPDLIENCVHFDL
jgi:hypothetical protein